MSDPWLTFDSVNLTDDDQVIRDGRVYNVVYTVPDHRRRTRYMDLKEPT